MAEELNASQIEVASLTVNAATRRSGTLAWILGITACVVGFLIISSGHYDGGDTKSYCAIADRSFSVDGQSVPYQFVQRAAYPLLIGFARELSGMSLRSSFLVGTVLLSGAVSCILLLILTDMGCTKAHAVGLAAIYLLNPYSLRYYLSTPAMATDLVFVLGILLIVMGSQRTSVLLVSIGAIVATIGRQTGIMVVPYLAILLFQVRKKDWLTRLMWGGAALIPVGIYIGSGAIASQYAPQSTNLEHIIGLFHWCAHSANVKEATVFAGKLSMTFLPLFFLTVGCWRVAQRRPVDWRVTGGENGFQFMAMVLLVVLILAQPILAGPTVSMKGVHRLSVLSLPVAIVAWGSFCRISRLTVSGKSTVGIIIVCCIQSFHHLFSFFGPAPSAKLSFAAMFTSGCVVLGFVSWLGIREDRKESAAT